MARTKYSPASQEVEELVSKISSELGLTGEVDFQALFVNKATDVCKVVKANDFTEYVSKRDDLVFVICYEDAFDLVDDATKYYWVRMAMDAVSYNSENGKVSLKCPSIAIPVGFYEKYKEAAVNAALTGQYTIAQIEEKRKEEDAARKALKTKKKKGFN